MMANARCRVSEMSSEVAWPELLLSSVSERCRSLCNPPVTRGRLLQKSVILEPFHFHVART